METTFNYLSLIDKWDTVKPYGITGRVATGLPKNNFEPTSYSTIVFDARYVEAPSLATAARDSWYHTRVSHGASWSEECLQLQVHKLLSRAEPSWK